jgi:hypothetical protein
VLELNLKPGLELSPVKWTVGPIDARVSPICRASSRENMWPPKGVIRSI